MVQLKMPMAARITAMWACILAVFPATVFAQSQTIYVKKYLGGTWVDAPLVGPGMYCGKSDEPGEVEIDQNAKKVYFWRLVGNASSYWIHAKNSDGTLGDIELIEAKCVISSAIRITIMGGSGSTPEYGSAGARHIGPSGGGNGIHIGLMTHTSITGKVTGNCYSLEVNESDGAVSMSVGGNITGSWRGHLLELGGVSAGGDITADFDFRGPSPGSLSASGSITGNIKLGRYTGDIIAGNLSAATILDDPDIQITPNECVCGVFHGVWKVNGQKSVCILDKATVLVLRAQDDAPEVSSNS